MYMSGKCGAYQKKPTLPKKTHFGLKIPGKNVQKKTKKNPKKIYQKSPLGIFRAEVGGFYGVFWYILGVLLYTSGGVYILGFFWYNLGGFFGASRMVQFRGFMIQLGGYKSGGFKHTSGGFQYIWPGFFRTFSGLFFYAYCLHEVVVYNWKYDTNTYKWVHQRGGGGRAVEG